MSYTADEEDEEEESGGLIPVYRWSWLAYGCSVINLAKCIAGNVAGHLDDVVTMLGTQVRHEQESYKFAEEVRADLEKLPVTKE